MTSAANQLRKEARLEDARNMLKEILLANEVYHLPLKPRCPEKWHNEIVYCL